MKSRLLIASALLLLAAGSRADVVRPSGLSRALADAMYANIAGDTFTGKLRFVNGSEVSPAADSAAGGGFFFTATGFAITSAGETTTICGVGCAAGSGGTFGWSSTSDATATADLRLTRVGAKQLGWTGSTAGAITHDFSALTATRVVTWPDLAGTVVFRESPTLVTPVINVITGVSRLLAVDTLAPTVGATGIGASGTATLATASSDIAGQIILTAGGAGIAASGTVTLTFATAYGTNGPMCVYTLRDATGSWNARATTIINSTSTTTTNVVNWDNNAVALASGSSYRLTYHCFGR